MEEEKISYVSYEDIHGTMYKDDIWKGYITSV
jgi:hypothetical protein